MKTAAIFPGQGSEYPGMLDCIRHEDVALRVFGRIGKITGRGIAEASFPNDPGYGLGDHLNAQLAVFGASACYWSLLADTASFDMVAGHSLGFTAALHASGALDFDDCVRVIVEVQSAIESLAGGSPGRMISVMGLTEQAMEDICRIAGHAFVSNVNSATQIVVSGTHEAVLRAGALALERGALNVKDLPIRHPLHSPLMNGIEEILQHFVDRLPVREPAIPLVSHLDGSILDKEGVRAVLGGQLVRKVAWRDTVKSLSEAGVTRFYEVGPSDTLSKLVRWIARDAESLKAEEVMKCRAA